MPRKTPAFTAQKNPTAARVAATTAKAMTKDDAIEYGRAAAEKMLKDVPEDVLPAAIFALRTCLHDRLRERDAKAVQVRMFADAGFGCLHGAIPENDKTTARS